MAWLNINKDLIFYDNEDGDYNLLGIVDDCPLPFRESFCTNQILKERWDFKSHRSGKRVEGVSIWKYANMILDKYLGKSFDKAFSYYIHKTKGIHDAHYQWFNQIGGRYDYYTIDDEGLIQKSERKYRNSFNHNEDSEKTYTFKSNDYELIWYNRFTEELKSNAEYQRLFQWGNPKFRKNRGDWYLIEYYGWAVENVLPKSKLERRLVYEDLDRMKLLQRHWKKQSLERQYSFLTREEEEFKKLKQEELWRLEKRGFDETSFRGEYYHGRKNKKINKL